MMRTATTLAGMIAFTMISGTSFAQEKDALSFEKSVLPIFQANCLKCHGDKKQKGGLDLRTKAGLLKGGETGVALKPGSLKESILWEKIRTDEMPEGDVKLTAAEKETIRRWIQAGAPGEAKVVPPTGVDVQITDEDRKFWAFQAPVRPPLPSVKLKERVRNPIDAFILAALEKKQLTLSPEADRLALLRRVSFDLAGLPPTPKDIDDFLNDKSPNAYEKVVDRLLASPRYGERWARHWLDLAHYADSHGYE
jgi:Protein of unknown function (DUF1549)/Planctomycete cytochrome C